VAERTGKRDERITVWVLRALFFASAVGVGLYVARDLDRPEKQFLCMLVAGAIAALVMAVEAGMGKSPIAYVSAIVFGLIIGFLAAQLLIGVVSLMGDFDDDAGRKLLRYLRLASTLIFCYLGVLYIFRTKDDIRFIVPYVEFQKRTKGPKPLVVDTSALIDGRIVDLASKGLFDAPLVVPRFVVEELQRVADMGDKNKRARGRRGLDRLRALQDLPLVDVEVLEQSGMGEPVDRQLIELAKARDGKVVTLDWNLVKVCDVEHVPVVNVNELATALRPPVVPGDRMPVKIVKPGESQAQGVGYLEDGTMVVVERARDRVGQEVAIVVTSSIQTSAGRMVFGRVAEPSDEAEDKAAAPAPAQPSEEKKPA
jgi:uncharacterized protein YacL